MSTPRILLYDIETAPAVALTFNLAKAFISLDGIIEHPRIIAWSAKWYHPEGKGRVMFNSEHKTSQTTMLTDLSKLLDEADVLVGYNSDGFDYKWIIGELVRQGIELPSPSQSIDLWKIGKSNFKFISGKLDYMSWRLLEERKVSNEGMAMWRKCMGFDGPDAQATAWRQMERYAKRDTALLEPLFDRLRPFIKTVNFGLFTEHTLACTACGSPDVQRRGVARTTAGVFQRFQCNHCGKWSRHYQRMGTTELRSL